MVAVMYRLSKIVKQKFTYQDVLDAYPALDYEGLYGVIHTWLEQDLIEPVKKSGMTSFRPAVYHTYKKVIKPSDYSMYTKEIESLHPKLNIGRYLSHPKDYVRQREHIGLFSEFLWEKEAEIGMQMSVNEKSFVIWGDEKFLDSGEGRKLLAYNRFALEDLGCYRTPEPYFSTVYGWDFRGHAVIIIENKDSWYTISKVMKESPKKQLCGIPVAMLIFGEGNKATRANGIREFLQDYPLDDSPIYYFGDIDVAGLDIYARVVEANKQLEIERFMPGYKAMIEKAKGRTMRPTEDMRKLSYPEVFLVGFSPAEQAVIQNTLKQQRRIPQEILNYQDYIRLCG